jgi:L-serine deaminase
MTTASILNNVIGPVMPGSSSSHTAGPYHIAKMCRSMIGELPCEISFTFEPASSIAEVYHEQGSDLALIMGTLDLPLTDPRFKKAFDLFPSYGVDIKFIVKSFPEACHPNSIKIEAKLKDGSLFTAVADSTGGGALLFRRLNGWEVEMTGDAYWLSVEVPAERSADVMEMLQKSGKVSASEKNGRSMLLLSTPAPVDSLIIEKLKSEKQLFSCLCAIPVFFPIRGERIFTSGEEMVKYAEEKGLSLGEAALEFESALLCMPKETLDAEMDRRLQVMIDSVTLGLSENSPQMFLLDPSAKKIMDAEKEGRLALGGIHTRAAARAMAAMQVNSGQGIVCAAPTGGSAGVIPGVMVTMLEDMKKTREEVVRSMWAAGAIGWVLATRGTFAAEVCGCQVEIGAAGAMGAGAVVEAAGGSARQAADAGAIMFQNAMGLVCDLVQAIVEIPCHTRNGSFASQAFICADMILGGYYNAVHIDDTVDAVYSSGKMLPLELRCTSLGGMAVTPSALSMPRKR